MGLTDPRALIHLMDELSSRLDRWSLHMSDHVLEADETQRCGDESVERGGRRARSVRARALDDKERADRCRFEVTRCLDAAAAALDQAAEARRRADGARMRAESAHSRWIAELQLAEGRLTVARAQEAHARAERDQAHEQVRQARAQLRAAEGALAQARTRTEYVGQDRDNRPVYRPVNLAPYQAAVAAAQSEVSRAERWLAECEARLHHAILETHAAEARVSACRLAVHYAEQARAAASSALAWAIEAGGAAAQAHEDALRADHFVTAVEQDVVEQLQLAEFAVARSVRATEHCEAARESFADAERETTSALNLSHGAREDMTFRIEQLEAFDA